MIDQLIVVSVVSVLLLLVAGVIHVRKQRPALDPKTASSEGPDTVAGWPPQVTRILSVAERNAYELLTRALPGYMVLAQLPLSRFIKVPTRFSYAQWLRRVGHHCVDLVVADPVSRVIAVIEVRSLQSPEKSFRRHERVTRVLDAVGIPIYQWAEGNLPTLQQVQALFNVHETSPLPQPHPTPAHIASLAPTLPPVDPATVTFFIANQALPDQQQPSATPPTREPKQAVSAMAPALTSAEHALDRPPTTWYDEFESHLPSNTDLAALEEQANKAL